MTTVRRLVMELGVVGDLDVKTKLQDIQNSANNLKMSLQEVEIQLTTLGRTMTQTPQFGGFGGSGSGSVLTSSERSNAEDVQSRIREQIDQTSLRESKQLEVAEKTLSLQEQMLNAMKAQVQGQQSIIKKQMSDIAADRQMFKNTAENLNTIIGQTVGFVQKAPRPLGKVGRPPKKYEYEYDKEKGVPVRQITEKFKEYIKPNVELIEKQKEAMRELPVIISEMKKALDPNIKKEMLDKLDDLRKAADEAAKALNKGVVKWKDDTSVKSNAGLTFPFVKPFEKGSYKEIFADMSGESRGHIKSWLEEAAEKRSKLLYDFPYKDLSGLRQKFSPIAPIGSKDAPKVDVEFERKPIFGEEYLRKDEESWFTKIKREGIRPTPFPPTETNIEARPHFPEKQDPSNWFLKGMRARLEKSLPVVKPFIPEAAPLPPSHLVGTTTGMIGTSPAAVDTDIADLEREIARLKRPADSPPSPTPHSSPVKPFIPISQPVPSSKPSTTAATTIGKLKAIDPTALEAARIAIYGEPVKPSEVKDERDVHNFVTQLLHRFSKESKKAVKTPELQRSRIAAQVANEFERADIKEKADKIREEIETEIIRDNEMKKRGFIFKPAERLRKRGEQLKSKYDEWKESIRGMAVGFVSKQKGFMSAGKYLGERERKRKILAEKVAAASEEGKQIVHNFTFEINNPVVDNDERMQTFIRSLTQAFKGMT